MPGDTIAEIGPTDIATDGELLIADRFLARVRLYGADGGFIAGQGRFGDGPFEYRRVLGVARDRGGRVIVHGHGLRGYTVLSETLEPDTVVALESAFSHALGAARHSQGVLQQLGSVDGELLQVYRGRSGAVRFSVPAGPPRIRAVPYWGSVARYYSASVGDTLILGNSLLYPFRLIGPDGLQLAEFGTPPPGHREAPELEAGELATRSPGTQSSRLTEWLASFDVVTGLHAVADRWLVVPHGRIATDPPGPPFQYVEARVDVYDMRTAAKVLEQVPLPAGARVLGGGPYLHVLVGEPPGPWTILRLSVR